MKHSRGALTAGTREAVFLQWASETGAHGMPAPGDLEKLGWHRLAEHPLFHGTWLMETPEARSVVAPGVAGRARLRTARPR